MKLSFVVPVSSTDDNYTEFSNRLKLLHDLGYDGAELAIQDPSKINIKRVKELLEKFSMAVPAIATGSAFSQEFLSLSSINATVWVEKNRQKAIQRIKDQIDFASDLGAKVIIGLIRGNWRSVNSVTRQLEYPGPQIALQRYELYKKSFSASLEECDSWATDKNVELVLEAVNHTEVDFLFTVGETADFVHKLNLKSTKVLADIYHMNIEEKEDIAPVFDQYCRMHKIGHIHIADNNRMAPGQGKLDFRKIIGRIKSLETEGFYSGFVSAELVPVKPDFETAARQTIKHLTSL